MEETDDETIDLSGPLFFPASVQVNLFQKHLFLHQLTHNMTTDCSMIYEFSTRKFHEQNMLRACQEHVI